MTRRRSGNPKSPIPPTRASFSKGKLKDTPANRALKPEVTPKSVFQGPGLLNEAYYHDDHSLILKGDVSRCLQRLIEHQIVVDCIVTSPPYYGQRDYGLKDQIGHEQHPQEFIDRLVQVFDLCRHLLRDTGSMWVNMGDTYWSGKGAHKSGEIKQGARRFGIRPQDRTGDGIWTKPKQLLLIPHRLAIALQGQGWLVRNDNVWVKPNPLPDQVRDRCSMSHEYVFHFTKHRWYYFDRLSIGRQTESGTVLPPHDTWVVPTANGKGPHRAAFSEELIRIPILATTPPGGIVLDPFNGSGTTMLFARSHGFRSIGIDLSAKFCQQAARGLSRLAIPSQEEDA